MAILTRFLAYTKAQAAVLNSYADEIERIARGVYGNNTNLSAPRIRVRRTSNQATVSGNNTAVSWQTTDGQDPDGMWDPAADTLLTFKTAGLWLFLVQVRYAAGGTTSNVRGPSVLLNTNVIATVPGTTENGGNGPTMQVSAGGLFTVGQQLSVTSFQNTGSNLNLLTDRGGTYLTGFWLGPP